MAVAEKSKSNLLTSVSLDAETDGLLEALAVAKCGGSRSKAVRHLVLAHAGRLIEELGAAIDPEQVDAWKRHRLSRDLIGEVAARIRAGATRKDAYQLSGVTAAQAQSWLSTGRGDVRAGRSSLHADFVMYLEKVEAELRLERVQSVRDPKWLLERQSPDQYARVTRSDSTVAHTFNLVIDWDALTLAEARTLVALLRKGSPGADGPALGRHDRPALDAVPAEIMAATIEDAEYEELEDESPSTSDAPLALEAGQAADTKAPTLDAEAPALDGHPLEPVAAPLHPAGEAEIGERETEHVDRGAEQLKRD